MGRGGKGVWNNKRRRSKDKGSDDSDEDYVVGDEETESLEESNSFSSLVPSEDDYMETYDEASDSFVEQPKAIKSKPKQQKGQSRRKKSRPKMSNRKSRVSRATYNVDDDDYDNDDDDDDDEEFVPDGDDSYEDDYKVQIHQRIRTHNRMVSKKGFAKGRKKMRKSKLVKKATKDTGRHVLNKVISSDDDFDFKEVNAQTKTPKKTERKKRKVVGNSDSDSVDSGTSDYEYTVSEEEREFIREAHINLNLTTTRLRNSSLPFDVPVDGGLEVQKRMRLGRKGKSKVEESQVDPGKQVCGICLSEERNGIVHGTLNCCNHYFCFTCIMEWSKVESRCPLCKQRFVTIVKEARSDIGISLRKMVIKIPRRDQVYRPSEEEIITFLNPYDNVVCIECQQGGDDELMLLCDICDSPAHTYCVGLGREVPEGNWYCEACKASHQDSTSSPKHNNIIDQSTSDKVASTGCTDGRRKADVFDLNIPYERTPQASQEQHVSHETHGFFSSVNPIRDALEAASPISSTVLGRRRLRFRIHNLLSTNRMNHSSEMPNSTTSGVDIARKEENSNPTWCIDRRSYSFDHPSCSQGSVNLVSANSSLLLKEENKDSIRTLSNGLHLEKLKSASERVYPSCTVSGNEQRNSSKTNSIYSLTLSTNGGVCDVRMDEEAKAQIQSIVRRHLELLTKDTNLEHNTFKEIARNSTHTILSACGYEHRRSIVVPVDPPSSCPHFEIDGDHNNSMLKGCCSTCFNCFVMDVVSKATKMKLASAILL